MKLNIKSTDLGGVARGGCKEEEPADLIRLAVLKATGNGHTKEMGLIC